MKEGHLKKGLPLFVWGIIVLWLVPTLLAVAIVPFALMYLSFLDVIKGDVLSGIMGIFFSLLLIFFEYAITRFIIRKRQGKSKRKKADISPNGLALNVINGQIAINNPFRGILVVGAAGSGKSESIAVPLLQEYAKKKFSGLVYDFKFPTLANDVQTFTGGNNHYYLDFHNPLNSYQVNPLSPKYIPNTSFAREYAQAIITNLMKESIKKPDFWTRSATDLLTACIWYLRKEHPDKCDLPHALAMITSKDEDLLYTLQQNDETAQMTISIYNAMERGASNQVSGVIGTLQGAVAQINTPELMYIFSGNDFSLDINDPQNPIVLTVGSYPTLTSTLAPLCSLVITVATKLMNQPHKHPSFVLLDEAPTVYIPNIEVLPNTGRSNKVSTVLMCQDLSQLTDGYGKEKADVLFSACNNHFYGRVSSSHTADILSKQFGKIDKVFTAQSKNTNRFGLSKGFGKSETIQERDKIKSGEFLQLKVGEFAGIVVETQEQHFKAQFCQADRPTAIPLNKPQRKAFVSPYESYRNIREEVQRVILLPNPKGMSGGRTHEVRRFDFNV